jgi:glycosyltransferase involved in cell wall biosynthesis
MKIAVYTIALNEEKYVERWYESSKEADYHFILDTGSTDKTVSIAKKLGIHVFKASIDPWRFDVARNTALSMLPKDIDFCISMDMDEVLVAGWREKLDALEGSNVTRPRHTFTFSFNPDGTPAYQFGGNRIHKRHGYVWKHPVHEIVVPYRIDELQSWVDIEMQHHPDKEKSRGQYLPLLEEATKEDPNDARMAYYYGRELFYYNRCREAIEELDRFLRLPTATWVGDRSDALIIIAKCVSDITEARQWAWMAIQEAPDRREGYVYLARLCYYAENFEEALMYSEQALAITERPLQYMCEDWAWDWQPWDIAAISAWVIGDKKKALEYGEKAYDMAPHVARLAENMKYFVG